MSYTTLGAIQLGSTVVSTVIAVVMAWGGYGYWALVWREVIRHACIAVATWLLCPWIPGLPRRGVDVHALLKFGGHLTAFNVIVYLTANVDQVLIGKVYGPTLLGLYRQAYQLVVWPVMQMTVPLSRVAEPTLSFLQDSPARYRQAYQKLVMTISLVMMPLLLFAVFYSREIVLVVLGERWIEAAPIFRVLAVAMFIRPAADSAGLLLVTCGHTRRYLNFGVMTGVIVLLSLSAGLYWGALGVAYGVLVASYAVLGLRLVYGFAGTPVDARAFFAAIETPLAASGAMAIVLGLLNAYLTMSNPLSVLALAMPVAAGSYTLAWLILPGGKDTLGKLASDLGVSLRLGRPSAAMTIAFWKRALGIQQ